MDLNEFARRVRRRGLLRVLAEGATPPQTPQRPPLPSVPQPPAPAAPQAEQPPPDPEATAELELDPIIGERLSGCTLSCPAVVTGLADLPAVERGGRVIEVALLRLRVRRPEGEADCCVRQHVPPEIRGVLEPGSGVMTLAHAHDRGVAIVDWAATGDWIGATLTFPNALEQYDWPSVEDWPAAGSIEILDINGMRERLHERRGAWILGSADLVSLTPLRSRVDRRDEWRIALQLRDGRTIQIKERIPVLALARLHPGDEARIGTPIDVLVSPDGEVTIDWEATLRQPELRRPRA
jgi:hypothetical protein